MPASEQADTAARVREGAVPNLKQVGGGVSITPLLELRVGIDYHAAPDPRYRKQLNVVA